MLQSANFGRLMEPGLRKVFFDAVKEKPMMYDSIYHVENSDKAIETDLRMGGFGLWEKKDSGGMVHFEDPTGTQPLQYIHEEFAKGFTVERKLVDDEQYNQIKKFSANMGRAARATIDTQAASVLNNAFATAGFDGQPLISSTHKRLDGGQMSNRLGYRNDGSGNITNNSYGGTNDGALSDRNLKAAIIQLRKQVDDRGIFINCDPEVLLVPPELEYIARTLVEGDRLSTAGNGILAGQTAVSDASTAKNTLPKLTVVVWAYLQSQTAWFLMDRTVAQLQFFWRKKLEFKNTQDFDTDQWKYKGYMRFSAGYSDYRGLVGSAGTGSA